MSSRALFGDSSSSDEDDDEEKPTTTRIKEDPAVKAEENKEDSSPGKNHKPKKTLHDSDDDEDNDDDKSDKSEDADIKGVVKKDPAADEDIKPKIKSYLGDDDSDEEEPEFDDGGVVGVSSKTLAGSVAPKKIQPAPPVRRRGEDGEDVEDDSDDARRKEEDEKPAVPRKQKWVVPETIESIKKQPELYVTKFPNLVGFQTQPFDLGRYDAREEEEDFGDAAYNLIRWRQNGSSNKIESNARLVEWEDGSFTLHIGTSEAFEIDTLPNTAATTPGFSKNGYLYLSQKAQDKSDDNDGAVVTVLECTGPVASRFTLRPSSLQSEAHKMLTVAVRKRTTQRAQIAQIATQVDPEKQKQERIRNKADLEKSNRARNAAGGGGGTRRRFHVSSRSRQDYLEEDDRDFDTTNIRALKRGAYQDDYIEDNDDEEEEDVGFMNRSAAAKRSKKQEESSDDDIVVGDEDDEEEEETFAVKKPKKTQQRQSLFDDDESD